MALELSVPGESLLAEAAAEAFLPGVDGHVVGQVHLLSEAFATEETTEGFLSRVNPHVDLQMWAAAEHFPTLGAAVCLLHRSASRVADGNFNDLQ